MADYGLRQRAFRPGRRWAVDNIDYARSLPPAEKAWLEKFNREYYDADVSAVDSFHDTPELRRSCYSAQNAAYRDVMSRGMTRLEEGAWLERQSNSNIRPEALVWVTEPPAPQMSFPF